MNKIRPFLFLSVAVFSLAALPAMAQTSSGSPGTISTLLNRPKATTPLQTQTVIAANKSAYEEARKKAELLNQQASAAMAAAHAADSSMRAKEMEAMFAAEKAKAIAAMTQRPDGDPTNPLAQQATAEGPVVKPYVAPSNAVRVYTQKKDPAADKPRRLFNVREQ